MAHSEKLILIDGSSFLYRAYFAVKQNFSTKDGQPTGATFVLTRMFRNLLAEFPGCKFIAVFDAKGKSFRSELYPEYKATRPPMPEELRAQIEQTHSIVKALGLPLISIAGVEADDVLGSYAKEAERQGINSIICTGDKDLAQLVNEHIELYDTMKNIRYDIPMVQEKYGVSPEHIIDFLALKGDSSDNIPGMKGVGDKTALALINHLGGVHAIKERLDEVASLNFRGAGTFKPKFEEQWPLIELSYRLATIKCDVELPLTLDEIAPPVANKQDLIEIFERLEFFSFVSELRQASVETNTTSQDVSEGNLSSQSPSPVKKRAPSHKSPTAKATTAPLLDIPSAVPASLLPELSLEHAHLRVDSYQQYFKTVLTDEDLQFLIADIKHHKFFTFHVCATEEHPSDASLVGLSICTGETSCYYIPVGHNYLMAPQQLERQVLLETLEPLFKDTKIAKVAYDLKLMRLYLHFAGLEGQGYQADPMIVAHILDSGRKVDLNKLSESLLHYSLMDLASLKEGRKDSVALIPIERMCHYECEQALVSFKLYQECMQRLKSMNQGEELVAFDMKVLDVLYKMECQGAYIDGEELNTQSRNLKTALHQVEQEIFELAGTTFNVNSPRQLSKVLFETLAIPYPRKSVKKDAQGNPSYSTADDILNDIGEEYAIIAKVQRFRMLSKLISTYADKLPSLISPRTGRIHTSFNLAGTVTGRLSSSDPNLQNIPGRSEEGRQIRSAFVAPKGYKIVSADYSQIELRLIAHFAQDPNLIAAFQHGLDIHKATAAEVLDKDIKEVTDDERKHAKATNFGLMYGMSAHGLAKQTHMSMPQAKDYIDKYFKKYPTIKALMDNIISQARAQGYISTLKGFHIAVDGINTKGAFARAAERAAINAPMQGSAADIIKMAMIEIEAYIESLPKDSVHMTLQVHDELIFEVRDDMVDMFCKQIKKIMENVTTLSVPLEVGIGVGSSWTDAH